MKTNSIFDVFPTDTENMSAEEYLNMPESSKRLDIVEAKFVPPVMGEPGFGHFEVKWRYPKYDINALLQNM